MSALLDEGMLKVDFVVGTATSLIAWVFFAVILAYLDKPTCKATFIACDKGLYDAAYGISVTGLVVFLILFILQFVRLGNWGNIFGRLQNLAYSFGSRAGGYY